MYASEDEILGIISFLRPSYTREDISEGIQAMAEADINSRLARLGFVVPVDDIAGLLKAAKICFYMELSGMVRETETAFGVIGTETIGSYTKKYENGMPMFFFASGGTEPFLELLPHESWRMRGYKYVSDFIKTYFTAEHGIRVEPSVVIDSANGWY